MRTTTSSGPGSEVRELPELDPSLAHGHDALHVNPIVDRRRFLVLEPVAPHAATDVDVLAGDVVTGR